MGSWLVPNSLSALERVSLHCSSFVFDDVRGGVVVGSYDFLIGDNFFTLLFFARAHCCLIVAKGLLSELALSAQSVLVNMLIFTYFAPLSLSVALATICGRLVSFLALLE
jgi:hypothetical protein